MDNYKPNSFKSKEKAAEERVKKDKVVTGAKLKQKNGFQKFFDEFINVDLPAVRDYVIKDVVIPSVKKVISDTVRNGIDMFLYGDPGKNRGNTPSSRISYGNMYGTSVKTNTNNNYGYGQARRATCDYDNIVLATRGDAELVLDQMNDIISRYQCVSVADLYDLVDITGNYTNNSYGWTDLRTAQIIQVRDGYLLKLPRAIPLD